MSTLISKRPLFIYFLCLWGVGGWSKKFKNENVSWLFENVLQTGVGLAGIMANTLAIPILCSKEMSSIFNRLLVLLAIYDNFYILCRWVNHVRCQNFLFRILFRLISYVKKVLEFWFCYCSSQNITTESWELRQ